MADPVTLMGASLAVSAIGGGMSAAGTIAGGSAAAQAGKLQQAAAYSQADQLTENAAGELAASQRTMLDTREKTQLTQGTLVAKAAGSGFNAGTGSMLNDAGQIGARGQNQALMDVFNGQNEMTGTLNKANAVRFGGDVAALEGSQKQTAADLSAAGTIASTAGSMFKTYGGAGGNPYIAYG
jgi:hypothetical protein